MSIHVRSSISGIERWGGNDGKAKVGRPGCLFGIHKCVVSKQVYETVNNPEMVCLVVIYEGM